MYFAIVYVCLHDMYECIGEHLLYFGFLNKACILYLFWTSKSYSVILVIIIVFPYTHDTGAVTRHGTR